MNDPQEFQVFHTLWTAAITVGGGVVAFFTKRLVDKVDQKADKSDIEEVKLTIRDFLERNANQHESNTRRLDQILMTLSDRQNRQNQRDRDR